MTAQILRNAFLTVHGGFSTDRVIADPELNERYLKECREAGLEESDFSLNKALLNLRKSGQFSDLPRAKRTSFDDEEYRFAAEMAIRHLERRDSITLDDVLCDPQRAAEFDALCEELAPGFGSLRYRWCALNLRKQRKLSPELVAQVVGVIRAMRISKQELIPENLPTQHGIYLFLTASDVLYIGEASNLRTRLKKHLEHSDNKLLARWLWDNPNEELLIELQLLPEGTSTRVRRAVETELIHNRKPLFNIRQQPGE